MQNTEDEHAESLQRGIDREVLECVCTEAGDHFLAKVKRKIVSVAEAKRIEKRRQKKLKKAARKAAREMTRSLASVCLAVLLFVACSTQGTPGDAEFHEPESDVAPEVILDAEPPEALDDAEDDGGGEEDVLEDEPDAFFICGCGWNNYNLDRMLVPCRPGWNLSKLRIGCDDAGRLNIWIPEHPGTFSEVIDPAPEGTSIELDDEDDCYHATLIMTFEDCDTFLGAWTVERVDEGCDACVEESFMVNGTRRP